MKKQIIVCCALAFLAAACNKSDIRSPQSSCYPCPENDGQDNTRDRKPGMLNTERRYVDSAKIKVPERDPITKKPINVLPI